MIMMCLLLGITRFFADEEVGTIHQAACEVDQELGFDGDLYRIVVCLAATARGTSRSGECAWAAYRFPQGV